MTADLTQQEMDLLLLTGSILWYADEEKQSSATERFEEAFAASLRGEYLGLADLLACMTALAQTAVEVMPEEKLESYWQQVLPRGPL